MKYFSGSHNSSKNLRPPDLYEYFVDNFWFESADLENQKIYVVNNPIPYGGPTVLRGAFARAAKWMWTRSG